MANPPAYHDVVGSSSKNEQDQARFHESDSKTLQRFSIRDEVGASRSQHVATLVSKLLPQIRQRAKSGLSRTTMLLLPSDQAGSSQRGELVGFPQDDMPILIQLEGRYDTTQFWTQDEALQVLQEQILMALVGDLPIEVVEKPITQIPAAATAKSSWWVRKSSKAPELSQLAPRQPKAAPVTVNVKMDHVNFRGENEYGLFETTRGRAVLVTVEVK